MAALNEEKPPTRWHPCKPSPPLCGSSAPRWQSCPSGTVHASAVLLRNRESKGGGSFKPGIQCPRFMSDWALLDVKKLGPCTRITSLETLSGWILRFIKHSRKFFAGPRLFHRKGDQWLWSQSFTSAVCGFNVFAYRFRRNVLYNVFTSIFMYLTSIIRGDDNLIPCFSGENGSKKCSDLLWP